MISKELESRILDCVDWTVEGNQIDLEAVGVLFEAYENSKWTKFDPKDESTWPKDCQECVTDRGYATFYTRDSWTGTEGIYYWERVSPSMGFEDIYNVTHWQPIPKFKGE